MTDQRQESEIILILLNRSDFRIVIFFCLVEWHYTKDLLISVICDMDKNIACSVARANALNVHVVTKRILAHAYCS